MIAPKYLIYHDLIGFDILARHKNKKEFMDIGKIIDDTKNMLIVAKNKEVKNLVKKDYIFQIKMKDGMLEVNGTKLLGVPENRLRSLKKKKRLRK
jgi:RNase P/RNase MRP subunit p29